MEQRLWALDLSLRYSDTLAMFQLVEYVTGGSLNTKTHTLSITPAKQDKKPKRRRLQGQEEVRFCRFQSALSDHRFAKWRRLQGQEEVRFRRFQGALSDHLFAVMSTRLHCLYVSMVT